MSPSATPKPHELSQPTLSPDTTREAEAVQLEIYRTMPSWRKIELVFEAIDMSRDLARAGIRSRFPEADGEEVERRLHDLVLGHELAREAYGPVKASQSTG